MTANITRNGASGPLPWMRALDVHPDVRLVVTDMDGTLLDGDGRVPESFWPLMDRMYDQGIAFAPASGRQLATLERLFDQRHPGSAYIAENGNLVSLGAEVLHASSMKRTVVSHVVQVMRETIQRNVGVVVCGLRSAYVERQDAAFLAEARRYYAKLQVVDDLSSVCDQTLKLAVFDFDDAEQMAQTAFADIPRDGLQVVVSGRHWIDVMLRHVNKATAVQALQERLGVKPSQTVAFGDYLNDAELLESAGLSFAMANAHEALRARAGYLAPSNCEEGVVKVLSGLLDVSARS